MSNTKINKHHFFFNHNGIKGHASFGKKPDKDTLDAFYKMVELASKMKLRTTTNGSKN